MPNSLCLRTFWSITIADALDPFPGGSIWVVGLPYQLFSPLWEGMKMGVDPIRHALN